MAIHEHAGGTVLERLGPDDLVETFGFLDRDPVLNVYLIALVMRDALGRAEDEFWAARRDDALVGLVHMSPRTGAVLPVCDDEAAAGRLAGRVLERLDRLPRRFQVIGPRAAVSAIVGRLSAAGVRPRLARGQVYLSLRPEDLRPFERLPALRPAVREDADLVFTSGADMRAEELDEDPRDTDPATYRRRVEAECRDGSTLLWIEDGALRFRASVSAVTGDAAQISGVFTPPAARRRGYARRAMAELCARLFERSRSVCLFVNDFNVPALALYESLGFTTLAPWASAFFTGRR